MTKTAERLKLQLATLSTDDRAELARYLIESLDQGEAVGWEEAWETELISRHGEIVRGEAGGKPADVVLAELRKKLS